MLIKIIPEWLSKLHFFFKRKNRATFFTKRSWAYILANKHKGKRQDIVHYIAKQNSTLRSFLQQNKATKMWQSHRIQKIDI